MIDHTIVNPPSLGEAKGYSNGIVLSPTAVKMLFVAGQVGWDKDHKFPEISDPAEAFVRQFEVALKNVLEVVRAAGGKPSHVARVTVFVTDKKLYNSKLREIGRIWRENMGKWYPAMTLVEVKSLLEDKAMVELEATAGVP